MLQQDFINLLIGVACTLGGWWMRTMWDYIKDLQKADILTNAKINDIEVLVAGNYITKAEVERLFAAVFNKLDRIEDKLDKKADKP